MKTYPTLTTFSDVQEFVQERPKMRLESYAPRKWQNFHLYRGVRDSTWALQTSLERAARTVDKTAWSGRIALLERNLLDQYLTEIWKFTPVANQETETFLHLSIMQHYGMPTRLLDFTADRWMALYFAQEDWDGSSDLALYRLQCHNESNRDRGGNKAPRADDNHPWSEAGVDRKRKRKWQPDINDMLGVIIRVGLDSTEPRLAAWKNPKLSVGWDTPAMRNSRLLRQGGFFVYNVDVTRSLDDDLKALGNRMTKVPIAASLVWEIRRKLTESGYTRWRVYWDGVEARMKELALKVAEECARRAKP